MELLRYNSTAIVPSVPFTNKLSVNDWTLVISVHFIALIIAITVPFTITTFINKWEFCPRQCLNSQFGNIGDGQQFKLIFKPHLNYQ